MSSKRKRDSEDEDFNQLSKQQKLDEVTRSGRVRKKPAKFVEDTVLAVETKPDISKLLATSPVSTTPRIKTNPVKQAVTPPIFIPVAIKEDPQSLITEDFSSNDEDSRTPSRSSRARKKSAKVLEMEEFEEAEKKQTTKKDGSKKTKSPVIHVGDHGDISSSHPIPILKIKDIPTTPKIDTISQPVNVQKSPVAGMMKSQTGQTLGDKSSASVIKLLLSSPTQSSKPSLSTNSVAQHSVPDVKSSSKSTKSKSNTAAELAAHLQKNSKIRHALEMPQTSLSPTNSNISVIKQQLNAGIDTSVVKTEPIETVDRIKTEPNIDPVAIMSVPMIKKEPKVKKSLKKSLDDAEESPFMSPSLPSPNVINVGSMNMGLDDGKKKKGKVKTDTAMSEEMLHDDFGLDMPEIELGDTGSNSFMEMEDDDGLMIPEEEVVTTEKKSVKDTKKKTLKGKKKVSAVQLGELCSNDGELVMDFSRMKADDKKKKKEKNQKEESAESAKKKRSPTAYMLWCSANRPRLVNDNPGIDFSTISKTLGEMWSNLSEKDKIVWKRKAKKAAGKGSTLITTGKTNPSKLPGSQTVSTARQMVIAQKTPVIPQTIVTSKQVKQSPIDDISTPVKGFGIEPLDVAAHLKIVGESLSIIGMKLQEHRGLIAVQGSLSVLLDSMLCAVAPLMCLTAVLPETNGLPAETHMKNLDNIAYIMPGL
ncbi:hypothetical protein ACF0H5_004961 [Mactra antiquata]